MSPSTIKDRVAIVGIGQTAFGKGLADSEMSLACQAIAAALDDCRHRPGGGRRPGVVHDGAVPTRSGDGAQRRARRHHVLLPGRVRRRRGLRHGPARGDGRRHRPVLGGRRLARPQAGRQGQPRVGPRPPRVAGRRVAVEPALGPAAPGRRDRDAGAPLHARVRGHARSPGQRRVGRSANTPTATRGHDVRTAAHARGVLRGALDLRAAVPVRQLPRDRRRRSPSCWCRPSAPATCLSRPVYVHACAQGLPPQHQAMVNYYNDDPLDGSGVGRRRRCSSGATPTSGPPTWSRPRSTTRSAH